MHNYLRDNHIPFLLISQVFQSGDSTVNHNAYLYDVFNKALDAPKDVRIVLTDYGVKAYSINWHK